MLLPILKASPPRWRRSATLRARSAFYLASAIHFGGWLEARGLDLAGLNEATIKAFGAHRCECPGGRSQKRVSRDYTARVERFADFLRQRGVIGAVADLTPETPSPLSTFRDWLLQHRGLAMQAVERHERLITRMLPALGADADAYNAASVRRVILDQIRGFRPAHAKTFVGALRIYLRFLATSGSCRPGLEHTLPTVAEWKLSSLPRYLNAEQVSRLIESCRCCCFGLGSGQAILPACAPLTLIGRRPRCGCEVKDAGMSASRCHRMPETRFWTT